MPPRSQRKDERNPIKITILLALILFITSITSTALTIYSQHLIIDKGTVIGDVAFKDNKTVEIKGRQVQYNIGDRVMLNGREYIRLTGNQIQIGDSSFIEGIRTVTSRWYQNVLFSQNLGQFDMNRAAQVGVDGVIFNLIPIAQDVLNVNLAGTSTSYNVQFVQDKIYVNEKGVMLQLSKEANKISVATIGIKKYNNIWMKVI